MGLSVLKFKWLRNSYRASFGMIYRNFAISCQLSRSVCTEFKIYQYQRQEKVQKFTRKGWLEKTKGRWKWCR